MEPTLCFLLCDTPIIYIQGSICRCSGGGLMVHNQQIDELCSIPCRKPGDRRTITVQTCGGAQTYSVYAEEKFYTHHAHLFNFRIQFKSCELWNTSHNYDALQIKINKSSVKSPLNKLERCAAACLDQNTTTKSIAFNDDNDRCLCIMSRTLNLNVNGGLDLTILPNNSCDRYCDNIMYDSTVEHKFKCGSLKDSRIWAIYDLNTTCPIGFIYIKELKKCISKYKGVSNLCPSPSMNYIYNGNLAWNIFLKIIEKLNLTKSIVSIDFDDYVTVDPSWMCSTTTNTINSNLSNRNFSTYYVLDSGCLRVRFYSLGSRRLSNRLCITNPISEDSLSYDARSYPIYGLELNKNMVNCPPQWFDINTECYRISDYPKTIQEARNSCIELPEELKKYNGLQEVTPNLFDDDDMRNIEVHKLMNLTTDALKGEIVQYTSQWQVHLGFFLLDTNASSTEQELGLFHSYVTDFPSLVSNVDVNLSSINEFQMINSNDDNNSSIQDDSCLVLTRLIIDEKQRSSIFKNSQIHNCSKPRHVLCKARTILGYNSHQICYSKPSTLGLPAMISNHLTYELCLSVCGILKTSSAVINMNKCYCVDVAESLMIDIEGNHVKYRTKDCGNPCPGNQNERCGNTDTMVIVHATDNIPSFKLDKNYILSKQHPDFIYDNCVHVNFPNKSGIYQFSLNHINDVHPRHCLELCKKYKQQYALLNSNKCLCTNIPMTKRQNALRLFIPPDFDCNQECQGNYLYTCGNTSNSTIYSVYVMHPRCPHNFQLSFDEQQCVQIDFSVKKNSFSTAQSYCQSIGGVLAKINDILEIQDLVFSSKLYGNHFDEYPYFYIPSLLNNTKYFWVDRTSDIINTNKTSDHFIGKCFETLKSFDQNCVVLHRENITVDNISTFQSCFTESDQCSSMSAIPVCVDKNLEFNLTTMSSTPDGVSSIISVNISTDYSCGDDTDYHFMNDYCYKVLFHETTWHNAKAECERDKAALFLPGKNTMYSLLKFLLLRQHSYTSSGVVHVDIFYDNQNRTAMKYSTISRSTLKPIRDSYDLDTLCESAFRRSYANFLFSPNLTMKDIDRLKSQQTTCGYIDFRSDYEPSISCDEISCNRSATVICQKSPIITTHTILAKRDYTNLPISSTDEESNSKKSISKSFISIILIFSIIFVLILVGFIYILHNRYVKRKNNRHRTKRLNNEPIYSQLLASSESNL
ncbi:unnamed protein product [Rotaria sordida]|uniref:WSC domain-containing protein n=1 Tax=Rotaria sordida TaxID=392033 RepID=A0A815LKT1_9BILA|nr:unnamed protein product [Rotaria sordida]